jgi:hypothetical protein
LGPRRTFDRTPSPPLPASHRAPLPASHPTPCCASLSFLSAVARRSHARRAMREQAAIVAQGSLSKMSSLSALSMLRRLRQLVVASRRQHCTRHPHGVHCGVTVHDVMPIAKVNIGLDGSILATDTAPPYRARSMRPTCRMAMHILQARAYDAAGRIHTTCIYVTARWIGRAWSASPCRVTHYRRVVVFALETNGWWPSPSACRGEQGQLNASAGRGSASVPGRAAVRVRRCTAWSCGPCRA